MRVFSRVILGLLMVAIAGGAYWYFMVRPGSQSAATASASTDLSQVVAVQTGDLSAKISVVGELTAVRREELSFERMSGSAPVIAMNVAAGSVVTAGQLLASIDPTTYQQALDQATSALQSAEETFGDLKTPPTDLELAEADLAISKAKLDLEQATQNLADLQAPDLTKLQQAVDDAVDSLALAKLQQSLTEVDASAKTLRDLRYAVGWNERRGAELQDLVGRGAANLEQTEELATVRDNLAEASVSLASAEAQRQLSLSAAAASVASAEETLAEARSDLAESSAGDEVALAKARLAIQQAQVSLQAAEEKRADLIAGADDTKLAAAQADLDKKRLAVSEAQLDLAGCTIVAPFDGTILARNAKIGDLVTSSGVVLTLADMTQLEVVASVDETTIRQVSDGQAAEITFDAFPGKTLTGAVRSVPLQGALQGGIMIYDVPISLEGAQELALLVGMTANVSIKTGEVKNALLIPALAVQNIGGFTQVMVPGAGADGASAASAAVAVPIEVGLSDGVYTQVVRGLNATDQVVVQLQASDSGLGQFRMGGGGLVGGGAFGGAARVVVGR